MKIQTHHTLFPALLFAVSIMVLPHGDGIAQSFAPTIQCSVTGPDSVFFDKVNYNQYLPGSFTVPVTITNTGQSAIDSVVVFPRSNQRFTVVPPTTVLVATSLVPADTVRTTFTLIVKPRQVSGFDTVTIAVSGKAGARTECIWVIWVEKEYKPVNEILCPPPGSITTSFVDTLNAYMPDPLAFPLTIINHGDAPSKETRILYVATPGVAPADGQEAIVDIGTIAADTGRVDRTFMLRIVRRTEDTTVTVRFKVQGKGGLGDRIIDTICSYTLFIPGAVDIDFRLDCQNDPDIKFENGTYTPNPFQWVVKVRNVGSGRAKNVRAGITLPPAYELDPSSPSQQNLGDMAVSEEKIVIWTIKARQVLNPDTSEICVHVFDEFNRIANCCDTLILPSVRVPDVSVNCYTTPDSVGVDPQTGRYLPSEFTVHVQVHNAGTETADSVQVELVITDPGISLVPPFQNKQLATLHLPPQGVVDTLWRLTPLPSTSVRNPSFLIRVTGANFDPALTNCGIHIAAALQPVLDCNAETFPQDTVHFNSSTLEYDRLVFTARVRNTGTSGARDLQATILLPPNISLPSAESPIKYLSTSLEIDSVWTVQWVLAPLKQRNGSLNDIGVEFRTGSVKSECKDWVFLIGIPPITVLSIPTNFLERYSRSLRVPIRIDECENKDIRRMNIVVRFDSTKVTLAGFDRDGSLLDSSWSFTPSIKSGQAEFVALNNDSSLHGQGDLVYMNFLVSFGYGADQLKIAATPMEFDSLASTVNNGTILARYFDGYIYVSGDCLYPLKASDNYVILENKPNPFNPSTTIGYVLPHSGHTRLIVYDLFGRTVATLVDRQQERGRYSEYFDASMYPAGIYLCRLETAGEVRTIKMVMTK